MTTLIDIHEGREALREALRLPDQERSGMAEAYGRGGGHGDPTPTGLIYVAAYSIENAPELAEYLTIEARWCGVNAVYEGRARRAPDVADQGKYIIGSLSCGTRVYAASPGHPNQFDLAHARVKLAAILSLHHSHISPLPDGTRAHAERILRGEQ